MRRRLTLLLILALGGLAAPAWTAPSAVHGRIAVPPAPVKLRGALPAALAAGAGPAAPASSVLEGATAAQLFLPRPTAGAAPSGAPQQCRLACAQAYYFCAGGDYPDDCPGQWAICRAGCDAPGVSQAVGGR